MLVLEFAVTGAGNCAVVGDVPYIWARTALGAFVMPALCSHRGGPLHLGHVTPDGKRLVCPWHGSTRPLTRMLKAGVPAVRRGDTVIAILRCEPDTSYTLEYLPVSDDLRVGTRGACIAPAARPEARAEGPTP